MKERSAACLRRLWRLPGYLFGRRLFGAMLSVFLLLLLVDRLFPLPLPTGSGYARLVTAANGKPLRAFADREGVWRYPVRPEEVSPLYLEVLLAYEDRWFYRHPGVNPLALLRALVQNLTSGRIISGGSTLTMQVARILEPHERTYAGKLRQLGRALQLEWHLSKEEILTLYLNQAPFGGPLAGVAAASHTYLGKGCGALTMAEAALLVALPQAPSRLRPDRHPEAAQLVRDKVLRRLQAQGRLDASEVISAMAERVVADAFAAPRRAPLLAERLRTRARADKPLTTTIDAGLQEELEGLVREAVERLPRGISAAVIVVENETMKVRCYLGSSHYGDPRRFGFIDMARAVRSPGSTLKPFLYGLALDEGLIHSESLLADAPRLFAEYRPANFGDAFSGPVSVSEALQKSLNLPAVQVLEALGPGRFAGSLEQAGLALSFPTGGGPGLPMILGGVGVRLSDLVGVFTSLANNGLAGRLRLTPEEPLLQKRLLSPGAAWIVREMLLANPPPDRMRGPRWRADQVRLAWKTGTSYGFRDAWALGAGPRYTIGVWLGRPDGTPVPGQYGLAEAAPLLFRIARCLPQEGAAFSDQPASVSRQSICWPLGRPWRPEEEDLCQARRQAYILNEQTPPTLGDGKNLEANPLTILLDQESGLQVAGACASEKVKIKRLALWPKNLEPWLALNQRRSSLFPAWSPNCPERPAASGTALRITSLMDGQILRPAGGQVQAPALNLTSLGGAGRRFWLIDGEFRFQSSGEETPPPIQLKAGRHRVSVIDETGNNDLVEIFVQGG